MNEKAQRRRFGTDVSTAAASEQFRRDLYQESLKPAGTEARKRVKQLMTHSYIPQVISSNEFSDKGNMRKTANKSNQGNVRAIGNKTDVKINSYWKAKKGDNLPK
ncbi:hypothetical protein [Cronobacter phage GY3]|uniref:Uncharacterized protein n=1 Tax=Cronobacter phage GY3 TaxID=3075035 RepID=A0AA48R2S1_9CAUD|nr:hypothetical protein [Cronobacter phage GY3]